MRAAIVLGLINGLATALLAVGLVLVYKAGRFVNFAHAQLGVTSAMLLGKFALDWGWPYWVALTICVAIGVGMGALVEFIVIRRMAGRSRTAIMIVTIGISQLLFALSFFDWLGAAPTKLVQEGFPIPFDTTIEIDSLVLRGQHVVMLVAVPLLAVALALFLKQTVTGKAIRAAASNPDAASLTGISVKRMSTFAWGLAGGLSAFTAILVAPGQSTFDVEALGPGLMLRALGAAVIGGLTSLPFAFGAGVSLGVAEAVALHYTRAGGSAEAIVFVIILIGLFARSRVLNAAAIDERIEVEEKPLIVPESIKNRTLVRYQRQILVLLGVFLLAIAPLLPVFRSAEDRFRLTLTLILALVAVAVTIISGWGGQVSLGHFAFVGVGAYLGARWLPDDWSLTATVIVAGLVGAGIAVVIGVPALRLKGFTLAVTTLGFAVSAHGWLFGQAWFAAEDAVSIPAPRVAGIGELSRQLDVYYVVVAVLVLAVAAAHALRRSGPGRLIVAVRDNDRAASSFGVSPTVVKLATFALSGFLATVAGVLYLAAWRNISIEQFGPQQSLQVFAMAVIGGLGSLTGAIMGSIFVFGLPAFLGDFFRSLFPATEQFSLVLAGAGLVIVQIQFPGGIFRVFRQKIWEPLLDAIARSETARLTGLEAGIQAGSDEKVVKPPKSAPSLSVRDVTLHFGGIAALNGVEIQVCSGEIVGLIGTNGAGKTTLLNVVSGHLTAESGSVQAFGRELVGMGPEYRPYFGIARSFQDAKLFPGLTVRETIQVALARTHRVGFLASMIHAPWVRWSEQRTRIRADELIELLGLAHWADVPTVELSTGTRRICDLAAQMAAQPRVLLLDEPTAGVAQREAEAFGPLLRRIRDQLDCSILVIEHDMPLMMGLADRIYCMESGRVIAEGTPEEVRNNARVIGSYLGTDTVAIQRSGGRVE